MKELVPEGLWSRSVPEMIASVGIWYHQLDLRGHLTPGYYDMQATLEHYQLPEDLSGQRVVDVGASNGFFSFELERRGAQVVATDMTSFEEHDYPDWYKAQELRRRGAEELARINWDELHGGFTVAHRVLESRVERVLGRIYELPQQLGPEFDLAFCSNVFIHLQNPVAAMEAIRCLLKPGAPAVFATPITLGHAGESAALLVGRPELCAWWMPTEAGFVRMCELAGFEGVEWRGSFPLERQKGEPIRDQIGVIHCRRPA